jgi:hypothetical protein
MDDLRYCPAPRYAGRRLDGCPNKHSIASLDDLRVEIEDWPEEHD